jgi:hypothetical protein
MVMTAACLGIALAAPAGAMALSTHSATDSTVNTNGELVATAKCAANEHVVSGGFKTSILDDASGEVVSRAVMGDRWTVQFYPSGPDTLTTYAYCAPKGAISLVQHQRQVPAQTGSPTYNTVATARCASGETLVSGGFEFLPSSGEPDSTTYRDYAVSPRKWTVMSAFDSPPATLAAFAYCGRGVIVKVRSSSSGRIPNDGHASATASCHKGETLLGGGYTTTPTPDYANTTGPDTYFYRSYRSGARSWTARAKNYSNASGKIAAFAYCMP